MALVNTDPLSGIVHKLVVCTTKYFPVTRESGMRDDEVARRVAISTSYFGVMNARPVSRRGLGINVSKIHLMMTGHHNTERHTSTTNS